MRYKPERALTLKFPNEHILRDIQTVEMRYKPERALTQIVRAASYGYSTGVEMRYKPERALTPLAISSIFLPTRCVEMRYKPERALTPEISLDILQSRILCRNEV